MNKFFLLTITFCLWSAVGFTQDSLKNSKKQDSMAVFSLEEKQKIWNTLQSLQEKEKVYDQKMSVFDAVSKQKQTEASAFIEPLINDIRSSYNRMNMVFIAFLIINLFILVYILYRQFQNKVTTNPDSESFPQAYLETLQNEISNLKNELEKHKKRINEIDANSIGLETYQKQLKDLEQKIKQDLKKDSEKQNQITTSTQKSNPVPPAVFDFSVLKSIYNEVSGSEKFIDIELVLNKLCELGYAENREKALAIVRQMERKYGTSSIIIETVREQGLTIFIK